MAKPGLDPTCSRRVKTPHCYFLIRSGWGRAPTRVLYFYLDFHRSTPPEIDTHASMVIWGGGGIMVPEVEVPVTDKSVE